MITVSLGSVHLSTHSYSFILGMPAFKTYSLPHFQICGTVLLTPVTMPHVTAPGLTYFIAGSLYLLTPFAHLGPPHPPI